ncbi:MAG: response regulator [Rhodospirillales bacterium]|nr:response regulator [Rhodospirillales bacterium]
MNVLVIDELAVVRAGLKPILARLGSNVTVHEAKSLEEALGTIARNGDLGLIIADVLSASVGGLASVRQLCEAAPKAPIVVFANGESSQTMVTAIDEGAKAFLPKTSTDELIDSVLKLVLAGGIYLPPEALANRQRANELGGGARSETIDDTFDVLSRRQREILSLLAEGLSNQAISDRLNLSLSTVKSHVTATMKALGVKNRTQAALIARTVAVRQSTRQVDQRRTGRRRGLERRNGDAPYGSNEADPPDAASPPPARSQRPRSLFFAKSGHELRTTLNSIIGFAAMLEGEVLGPLGDVKYKEYARDIRASSTHLLEVLMEMLLEIVARSAEAPGADSPALIALDTKIDVRRAVEGCIEMATETARRTGVKLETFVAAQPMELVSNERAMKQILLNLLATAIGNTPRGGVVRLETGIAESGEIVITVHDGGPNLSEEDIRRILHPFPNTEARSVSGLQQPWLGLSLVKSLVEMVGGSLAIESGNGKGMITSVRFPRALA